MTPAQSLTDVIQPTLPAAPSSLSVRLMPSPVVIRWTSWQSTGYIFETSETVNYISLSVLLSIDTLIVAIKTLANTV